MSAREITDIGACAEYIAENMQNNWLWAEKKSLEYLQVAIKEFPRVGL